MGSHSFCYYAGKLKQEEKNEEKHSSGHRGHSCGCRMHSGDFRKFPGIRHCGIRRDNVRRGHCFMADVEQEGQEQADLALRPVNRSGRGGRVPVGIRGIQQGHHDHDNYGGVRIGSGNSGIDSVRGSAEDAGTVGMKRIL